MTEPLSRIFTLDQCRRFYAEEIRFVSGGCPAELAAAYARVPRERFLGPPPWRIPVGNVFEPHGYQNTREPRDLYHDIVVALDPARQLNSAQPSIMMRLLVALSLGGGARVVHVGCGVGYYTAILSELVGAGGSVVAIDADAGLAARAAENLADRPNVTVIHGDGACHAPQGADAILVNAGITHPPAVWLDGLAAAGVLVAPFHVGTQPEMREALALRLQRAGTDFRAALVCQLAIYPCTSQRDSEVQSQWNASVQSRSILTLQSARTDRHPREASCIVHTERFCVSARPLSG